MEDIKQQSKISKMPTKRELEISTLLARIDERVQVLPQMKQDIRDIKDCIGKHDTRIAILEEENKNNIHFKNNGKNPLIKFLIILLRFFGK